MKFIGRLAALACAFSAPFATLAQQAQGSQLEGILNIGSTSSSEQNQVAYVREQVLREAATALGARAGLADRSKELLAILDTRIANLDQRYNFNPLVIGNSVLPPVISESKDVVALEATAMRVAGAVYRIDEPARFAMPTPTWRDWLHVGLDSAAVAVPSLGANGPNTSAERELWKRVVKESYELGRTQAQAVFDANLALLERVHAGMRLYYDLWHRGMVSAPIIATSSDIQVQEDPNTISVGNTLFRITAQTDFRPHQQWTPLE